MARRNDWICRRGDHDFSGKELTPQQRQALYRAVEHDGLGLVHVAGENGVVANWKAGPLADLLPIRIEDKPPEKPTKPREIAVCYVLDRSGSMNGPLPGAATAANKLDLVKASIQASVQGLEDNGQVAVIAFDNEVDVIVPPTQLTNKPQVVGLLDTLTIGGGTDMAPALEKALSLLAGMKGAKYLIVLTDGQTGPPPGGPGFWSDIAAAARRQQISWTSIAVGADADSELLQRLANDVSGRFFFCDRADQIPTVFISQAKEISTDSKLPDPPFRPLPGPAFSLLKHLSADQFPELTGRVRTSAKPQVQVIQLAPENQPLLATWQFGVGHVTAFASDAKAGWARNWISWNHFSTYWCQIVQAVAHRREQIHVQVRTTPVEHGVSFRCIATDDNGRPVTNLKPGAQRGPTSKPSENDVTWKTAGPGVYEAVVRSGGGRAHEKVILTLQSAQSTFRYAAFVGSRSIVEDRITGPDEAALIAIAEAGKGLYSADDAAAIAARCLEPLTHTSTTDHRLRPYLIVVAVLLWPFDVLLRRYFAK